MAGKFDPKASGYIEVKDRIIAFYEAFPLGSIQSEVVELNENLVVMKAYAYRTADDARPGVGHSQMPIPGKTPYTVDSEVENAETSAWGRAIAALGFEVKRSIATTDEIEMKSAGLGDPILTDDASAKPVSSTTAAKPKKATPVQKARLMSRGKSVGGSAEWVKQFVKEVTGKTTKADLTMPDMVVLFAKLDEVEDALKAGTAAMEEEEPEDVGFAAGSDDEGEE